MTPVPESHINGAAPSTSTAQSTTPSSSSTESMFDSVEDTIASFGRGEFVVILDDENRENEGDLIIAADRITPSQMAWLIRHSSGFVCISLHPSIIEYLGLPMMVPQNTDRHKTAYTVTLDYQHGTTTGISAHDRALTSRKLARVGELIARRREGGDKEADGIVDKEEAEKEGLRPEDFSRPGHLNPLRYTEGGVRKRRGHTEASVDLCLASGRPPAGLLCELVDPDSAEGDIAARDACLKFAREHKLRICTIEAMVQWQESQ
ncbi:unnamed protein product [Tilletia controversa]|uniref:3,4-dihydroxy-2-butanone 4-phosphate synthase n=3 Tax=Tilletia TaxID=13289 RepID=A0A8X7MWV6_9BASI|nr:hypothetical protein CF336_g3742 [Tilletia laevis]KAE8201846.1 hypothetical protein CF328_g2555 [Tilletia controversa]KAE8261638.1 hypothetical protein A4X03_0g3091 [Tilletia caries]KAE8203819.1 hypothetical protein CF335_g2883 [Tilletia laevis]KAE8250177.1 hypothetical protein A4X06_0g2886 [Tilletia controversa]